MTSVPLWNAQFGFRDLDNQIDEHAEQIDWYPGALCACSLDPGEPDISHVLCHGTGHVQFVDQRRTLRAIVTNFNVRYHQSEAGTAIPGDVVVVPRPRQPVLISQWDMIRMPHWQRGEPYQGDVITHPGVGNAVALTYPVQRFVRAFSVTGGPSTAYTDYVEGVDFTINGHVMTWLTGTAGTIVSVKYMAIMEYIVVEGAQIRHERGSDLGSSFIARKREMILPGLTTSQT